MTAVLNQEDFADAVGLSPTRVRQLLGEGLPQDMLGHIPLREGKAWIETNLDPARREARKPGSTDHSAVEKSSIAALRGEKLKQEIRLATLQADEKAGVLIDRRAAESAIFARGRMERDAWTGWISRTAPLLAAETGADHAKTFAALDRFVRQHLAELAAKSWEGLTHA